MFLPHRKRRIWPYIAFAFAIFFIAIASFGYRLLSTLTPEKVFQSRIVQKALNAQLAGSADALASLLPELSGFSSPKTYLLLFQNNTEMRPAGGFIGAYAVVRVENGRPETLAVEGTEILDKRTPASWKPVPPRPIADHLKVDRWYFRDSNWSPDFAESAKKALAFYRAEGGVAADDVDAVVAVTPTVLEEILALTGPLSVQGIQFAGDNVTETLEYEVEYGYDDRGLPFHERKQILGPFMHALQKKVEETAVFKLGRYGALARRMAEEKHVLFYSPHEEWQAAARQAGVTGEIRRADGDYLLWADANLAALKTDHAMDRALQYSLLRSGDGTTATAAMEYRHRGRFDWRTTRYRSYARVYVPLGSQLVSAQVIGKDGRTVPAQSVDRGEELGKSWFGAFISIEPGDAKTLSFTYRLPDSAVPGAVGSTYALLVQKQAGTIAHGLTLNLDFDTTSTTVMHTDLRVDREFRVNF